MPDYRQMWIDLGMDVEKHDLREVGGCSLSSMCD